MSATAEALVEQIKKLPPADQQQIIQELVRCVPTALPQQQKPFPTVKIAGGAITSTQVAEELDDE